MKVWFMVDEAQWMPGWMDAFFSGANRQCMSPTFSRFKDGTYVKTKKREVEPTRRQAAVHTGMKAPGFSESAPLAGILSSPHASESHYWRKRPQTHRESSLSACAAFTDKALRQIIAGAWRFKRNPAAAAAPLAPAARADCPRPAGRQQRSAAASGLSQRWSFYSRITWNTTTLTPPWEPTLRAGQQLVFF